MKTLRIDDIEGLPVLGSLMWQPVRRPLGITGFGINAYTAGNAGDEVVEDHTELVDEEAYIVIRGHATFTVDGEEIDAPWGTIVFLDDLNQQRSAIAKEAGTTVLAIGGRAGHAPDLVVGVHLPVAPRAQRRGLGHGARDPRGGGRRAADIPAIRYHLARVEARAGNTDRALELLRGACEERPDYVGAGGERRRLRVDQGRPALPERPLQNARSADSAHGLPPSYARDSVVTTEPEEAQS